MKRALLLRGAVTAMLGAAPFMAVADTSVPASVQVAQAAAGEVDAGELIGQEVYDAQGEKVGDIDSVMVDDRGQVTSVVIDMSGWLESEKLVPVQWSDLKRGKDDRITTSMTKESATSAEAYSYKDENLRGKVMTEAGEPYAAAEAPADTATTTRNADADAAITADADAGDAQHDSAVLNADGSMNASKLIGLDVQSPEDEKVGDISEVVLDNGGQVQGVVVDVGGFLGIATRPVLLDWKDVKLATENGQDRAVVNLTKENLEQMPAYESSNQ
jgi:sporulation protein YlmC with PRC-barrel domain